jgi:GNAT superfamily N-acetyltransferase
VAATHAEPLAALLAGEAGLGDRRAADLAASSSIAENETYVNVRIRIARQIRPRAAVATANVPHNDVMQAAGPDLTFADVAAADIADLARLTSRSFRAYRAFAPDGWRPPDEDAVRRLLDRWRRAPGYWGRVARSPEGTLAGHITFLPAAQHPRFPTDDRALVHIGELFLVPERWGTGLASELLGQAGEAARARGFTAMRLFVAEGQLRAQRFYEREGFARAGGPFDVGLGLPSLEYRRAA